MSISLSKLSEKAKMLSPVAWSHKISGYLTDNLDNPDKIKRSAYSFMPAALEIQETPPSPIGRAIIWSIMLFLIIAIVWGVLGKINVVAISQGKIVPSGRVKTIQPLEIGTIKVIHVREGQIVKRGEPLLTLDNTTTKADVDRLQTQLTVITLEMKRQRLFHQFLDQATPSESWTFQMHEELDIGESIYQKQIALEHYQLLSEQLKEYEYKQAAIKSELERQKAEQTAIRASINKIKRTLPIITERTESFQKLLHDNLVSRTQYLELEQERIEKEQDLLSLNAQSQELDASIKSTQAQLSGYKAEAQKNNLNQLNESSQQLIALQQELIKAKQRVLQQVIRSPVDGTVQQLAIHTIGAVVTPAQELMIIVPKESVLEVEALVLNKDIGFVHEGQLAEVKVDTFNFTKYGLVDGKISYLSDDAIQDENLGLVYKAVVQLDKTQMWVNGKAINLSAGMTTTVEVKTEKRRIIEYFLSPLLRYKQESIRER